jgi:hypothetical protein
VTTIGERAFRGCTGLKALALSNTLRFIGWKSFQDCTGLEELALPASLEDIAYNAFSGCTRLTKLHLPRSVRVAELVLALGEKCGGLPQLSVDGVPCPPEDVLQPAHPKPRSVLGRKNLKSSGFFLDKKVVRFIWSGSVS